MTDPTNPPAGWYDDGRGQQRYWDGAQWTEHTAPLPPPADQAATLPYDTAALGGTAGAGTAAYAGTGTTPYAVAPAGTTTTPGAPASPPEPVKVNVVGVVALVVAAVGFVLACIPFVQVGGVILLPAAFVLSIVALFLEGRKWPAITGLILSILGAIIGAIVFALVTLNVIGQVADFGAIQDEIEEQLEEQFGTPVPPEEEPDAAPTAGLAFGETMTWENGVSMTVSEPEPFTPSDLSLGADQAVNLAFTLTITNDSSENVQPVVLSRLASDGADATRIIDVGAEGGQVGIPPTTAIPPGESITWQEAWSVADPDSLTMQTAPSFQYEDAVFTNVP